MQGGQVGGQGEHEDHGDVARKVAGHSDQTVAEGNKKVHKPKKYLSIKEINTMNI